MKSKENLARKLEGIPELLGGKEKQLY